MVGVGVGVGVKEESLWHSASEGKSMRCVHSGELGTLLSSAVLLINNQGLSV